MLVNVFNFNVFYYTGVWQVKLHCPVIYIYIYIFLLSIEKCKEKHSSANAQQREGNVLCCSWSNEIEARSSAHMKKNYTAV